MERTFLQELTNNRKEIYITYKREKDEMIKTYHLEPVDIKSEILKDGSHELYLFAIKLPKGLVTKPKIQKFILKRIISAH